MTSVKDFKILKNGLMAMAFDDANGGLHYINIIMDSKTLVVAHMVNKECYDAVLDSVPSIKAGTPEYQSFIDNITTICELPKHRHMPVLGPTVIDNDIILEFVLEDEEQGRVYCILGLNPFTYDYQWTTLKFDRRGEN